ncbi:5-hydroxyisourate hydrolase [Methylacidimicrobium sp. AP8]|uniref:hydroxyisourate hydrolase n=1 Tax=Methylacidimicrobium sp. AP8 TaxID=2730359 RepID=UPI0018BFE4AF|nr:hydroxyisourate hydrolase [Methylacidimicrobium sp. AP8]CAB4242747.1 5-hydroxyisourate hydrolase [Methylacidimicrobium sp. AP8]
MSRLTTHVLDLFHGKPAQGVLLRLCRPESKEILFEGRTDADGRAACASSGRPDLPAGRYELLFAIGSYFARAGVRQDDPPFLEEIVIRFGMSGEATPYHLPLLVTPWSYTTYRGR